MTVSSVKAYIKYEPDGVATDYVYPFRIISEGDIEVRFDDDPASIPFTVTGVGDYDGGHIIFDSPPPAGIVLTILRWMDIDQQTDYIEYGAFDPDTIETDFDKVVMVCQQLIAIADFTLRLPVWADPDFNFTLPMPEANKCFKINADATAIIMSQYDVDTVVPIAEDAANRAEASASAAAISEQNSLASEIAAAESEYNAELSEIEAYHWAQYPHNQPVPEGDGTEFSAYHWAIEAQGGGLLAVESSDTEMITPLIDTPIARHTTLQIHSNQALGIPKIQADGKIPIEILPFTGFQLVGPYRGDDECPKPGDEEGDCIVPDTRNPSERFTDHTFINGNLVIISSDGTMNYMNDSQVPEVQDIFKGDGLIYADGNNPDIPEGWYRIPGLATGTVLAEFVLFDDSNTVVKGQNLQIWNENADAAILARVAKSGDSMHGSLSLEYIEPEIIFDNTTYPEGSVGKIYRLQNQDGCFCFHCRIQDGSFVHHISLHPTGIFEAFYGFKSPYTFLEGNSPHISFKDTAVTDGDYTIRLDNGQYILENRLSDGTVNQNIFTASPSNISFQVPLRSSAPPSHGDDLANKNYVDTADTNLQNNINLKADITYVNNQDAALQNNIDLKADITYVDNADSNLQNNINTKVSSVTTADPNSHRISNMVSLTQTDYDNLTPVADTLYVIIE